MRYIMIVSILLFSGCFSVNPNLTPAGAKVKIVKNKPNGCKSLGKIKPSYATDEKIALNVMRNKVASKGGDTARITWSGVDDMNSATYYSFKGYMYKCRDK